MAAGTSPRRLSHWRSVQKGQSLCSPEVSHKEHPSDSKRTAEVSQREHRSDSEGTARLSQEVSQREDHCRRSSAIGCVPLDEDEFERGGESIDTEKQRFPLLVGFVRFEPEERKVRGKVVREIRLRPFGGSEDEVVWLWPEFAHVQVMEGDLVAVQGRRETWYREDIVDGKMRSVETLNARTLFRLPAEQPIPGV